LILAIFLVGCASVDSGPKGYIKVDCTGNTVEHAKTNCFNKAVELTVGTVVVAGTEALNNNLVKYEILKHSAGYVDDYRIITQTSEGDKTKLVMAVKVRDSKIAERIMNVQTAKGNIQGERLGDQYASFMRNKSTGDQLLNTILSDYPKHAFNVEKGKIQYQVDINRDPVIVIPYKVKWNYKYLQALKEAMSLTQDEKSRQMLQEQVSVISKDPKAWVMGSTDNFYFNDIQRARMIKRTFIDRMYVHVKFKDFNGKVIIAGCDDGVYLGAMHTMDPFVINGNQVIDEEMNITIRANKHKIENIMDVEVSFSNVQCTFVE
jgi:major membrane immunogen (membrane-anchored lipoprotein)